MTELPPQPQGDDTLVADLTSHTIGDPEMAATALKPWAATSSKRYRLVDASLIGE